jgi:integrase
MASVFQDAKGCRIQWINGAGERKGFRVSKWAKRDAETLASHVEHLNAAKTIGEAPPMETARYVAELPLTIRAKLAANGLIAEAARPEGKTPTTLGPFLDRYIADRKASQARRTVINWQQATRSLVEFFGAEKPLAEITVADANAFRRWLMTAAESRSRGSAANAARRGVENTGGLAPNTYNRRCGFARQFFAEAVDARLISENPFAKMKGLRVRANKARDYIVSPEDTARILAALPTTRWRLIFTLARFGGLRCPSEYKPLTWGDVDWIGNRIRIDSPKTGVRFIPIFPELRPYLEAALAEAGDPLPDVRLIAHRGASWNFGTDLKRFVELAGVTPWTKIFQNLRLTRANELAAVWPQHVVCEWLGHSRAVAGEHYLRATDADFTAAAGGAIAAAVGGAIAPKVVQTVVQQGAQPNVTKTNHETASRKTPAKPVILPVSVDLHYTPQESTGGEIVGENRGRSRGGAKSGAIAGVVAELLQLSKSDREAILTLLAATV